MDKKIIMQYKASFDSIVQYIESDDAKEQIEVMPVGRTFWSQYIVQWIHVSRRISVLMIIFVRSRK